MTNNKLEKQRQEAFVRIGKKLEILERWAEEGIPFKLVNGNKQIDTNGNYILEYFPTSVRSLRLWTAEKNSNEVALKYQIPKTQTSDQAWKAAPKATIIRAEGDEFKLSIFALLKEKATIQRSYKQKTKICELEEKLAFSEKNRVGLASELVQLRLENKSLESELRIAQTKLSDAQQLMSKQLEFKKNIQQQADNENADLRNLVSKLKARLIENSIDISDIAKANSVIIFPGASNAKK